MNLVTNLFVAYVAYTSVSYLGPIYLIILCLLLSSLVPMRKRCAHSFGKLEKVPLGNVVKHYSSPYFVCSAKGV
jgi:hypothetical protein